MLSFEGSIWSNSNSCPLGIQPQLPAEASKAAERILNNLHTATWPNDNGLFPPPLKHLVGCLAHRAQIFLSITKI